MSAPPGPGPAPGGEGPSFPWLTLHAGVLVGGLWGVVGPFLVLVLLLASGPATANWPLAALLGLVGGLPLLLVLPLLAVSTLHVFATGVVIGTAFGVIVMGGDLRRDHRRLLIRR